MEIWIFELLVHFVVTDHLFVLSENLLNPLISSSKTVTVSDGTETQRLIDAPNVK